MERSDGKKVKVPPFHRIFILTFNTEKEADSAIDILKKSKAIVFAEKNSEPVLDNDEYYIDGTQWYLNNNGNNGGIVGADINAEGAWAIYTGNANNNIAIIDAGVELTHEDLTGKATGDTDVGFSHGTLVAGVAAARANNTHGIRGVDWNAQIISKRIYDANRNYLGDAVTAQKITDAVNEGADVLNCSWSSPTNSSTLALAFAYAYKMNRVSVATMGNTWTQEIRYPGAFGNVMAVGATQNDDTHSPWSTTESHIDVAAPGGINVASLVDERDIFSTTLNNGYEYTSGTSFSAPLVSGLVSLLEGFNSNLANDDIRQIIRLSADDRGDPGFDNALGFGRINAEQALLFLNEPYTVAQHSISGGSTYSTTGSYQMNFFGVSGLADGMYIVERSEVRKTITFPQAFCNIISAWGRGSFSNGYSQRSPNFGEDYCEIVPGTLTNAGATLRTYVYKVWRTNGSYLGYYPSTAPNVNYAYTVLGIEQPILSGSSNICYSGTTYTLQDPPSGTTFIWGGTNVVYPNGNTGTSVTVRASSSATSSSGTITVSFTIDNQQCIIEKDVWVGKPNKPVTSPAQSSMTDAQVGNIIPVNIISVEGGDKNLGNWSASGTISVSNPAMNPGSSMIFDADAIGYGFWYVNVSNDCGTSYNTSGTVDVSISGGPGGLFSLNVVPNPTTTETEAELIRNDGEPVDENITWEVEVYDLGMKLKFKSKKIHGKKYKIKVNSWKEGIYVIRAYIDDEIVTKKFIKK